MTFPHAAPLFVDQIRPSTLLATVCGVSPFVQIWSVNKTAFTLLPNPATLPAGTGQCLDFNPAGDKLAVGHQNSPNMTVYSISGTTFTKMANPSNIPAGPAEGIAFSPNGLWLGEGDNGNPQNSVYTYAPGLVRVGSSGNYAGEDTDVTFSPDSSLFVIAANSNSSPFMRIYTVGSGGTLTQISNPASPPSMGQGCVAFNPAGTLCFLGGGSSGFSTSFNLYGVSGTTFTRLSNPATVPGSTAGINGAAFSPNGKLFVLVTGQSPYIYPYSVNGNALTYLGSPSVIPATGRIGVAFSRDGKLLALSGQSSPNINMYRVSGTTLTNITAPAGAILNTTQIAFN